MSPSLFQRFRKQKPLVSSDTPIGVPETTALADPANESHRPQAWPPILPGAAQTYLLNQVQDWQILHGSLIKRPVMPAEQQNRVPIAFPIGASLFPTPYPRHLFEEAQDLQFMYNELYSRVSSDESWLREVTADLCEVDDFARVLWEIWDQTLATRKVRGIVVLEQELALGIWRSDYMLQKDHNGHDRSGLCLKQVEFNTLSCAGGIHSNRISDMHRYLATTGAYDVPPSELQPDLPHITSDRLPLNRTLMGITKALATAHSHYTSAEPQLPTCMLMVVQPHNINVADERPIEEALWTHHPKIPCFRLEFPQSVLDSTHLSPAGALIYTPPERPHTPYEVSVIYLRAGHDVHEYFQDMPPRRATSDVHDQHHRTAVRIPSSRSAGALARVRLEASTAIKTPPLLGHIATLKRVQAALTAPGALERFVAAKSAARIRQTFVPLYGMREEHAQAVVEDANEVVRWILKPSLEGGGHGVFGAAIPGFLAGVPERDRGLYVLMRKIEPPRIRGRLMSLRGTYEGGVVYELGIFGGCLWRCGIGRGHEVDDDGTRVDVLVNEQAGWSLKTKAETIDEMSVVKGYGCFDSPLLLDDEAFRTVSDAC